MEVLDFFANSHSQYLRNCVENSMEDVHIDVWV